MTRTVLLLLLGLVPAALLLAGLFAGSAAARGVASDYPPEGNFVSVDGTRLHFKVTGPEDAAPLLVLHGASSNLNEPRVALEDALSGYRVYWLDRPGLGWSERPGDVAWSPQREAALIAQFLESQGVAQTPVLGHSWGAAIALRLAMDQRDRVTGLVLIAPAARAWVGDAAFYNKATHWPLIGTLITRVIVPTYGRSQVAEGAQQAFSPEPVPENYVERTHLPLILRAPAWKANAYDMAHVNTHLADQETRYDTITVPTVILAGPEDTVVSTQGHAGRIAETMPNAELELIEGAGHNLHHHHPDRVRAAVDRVSARGAENR